MPWDILTFITLFKLSLYPSYHSTDFEVHRNWLAITHSLPVEKWYTESTSPWTLDYPPLFAWFQFIISFPALLFDSAMLDVKNLNYDSHNTILYMRLTVIISDVILAYGVQECCSYLSSSGLRKSSKWSSRWHSPVRVLQLLILCNVGLLVVDHMHFQYNGILFGILLLSIASVLKGQHVRSAFYFSVLLNMKHIFLYMAPPFFIYLLRNFCFPGSSSGFLVRPGQFAVKNFLALAATVAGIFSVSFMPFVYYGQIPQVLSRLFPFKRGLSHSYWAPNFWALYSTSDKVLEIILRTIGFNIPKSTITLGLPEDATYSVLPNVPPIATFILTFIFSAPCLLKLWRFPGNPVQFVRSLVLCALTSFIFGWHVHEKAILMAIIPLSIMAVIWQREARVFSILSLTGYFSLLPLIPPGLESIIKYELILIHAVYTLFDDQMRFSFYFPMLTKVESLYLLGLVPLAIVVSLVLPYVLPQLPFMPLLLTSAYCSLGIIYCWISYYHYFLSRHEENHKKKVH